MLLNVLCNVSRIQTLAGDSLNNDSLSNSSAYATVMNHTETLSYRIIIADELSSAKATTATHRDEATVLAVGARAKSSVTLDCALTVTRQ